MGRDDTENYFQDSSVVLGYPMYVDKEFELQNDEIMYYTNSMAGWAKQSICTSTLFHGLKKSLFPWEQILFSHVLWSWISLHQLKNWPCVFKGYTCQFLTGLGSLGRVFPNFIFFSETQSLTIYAQYWLSLTLHLWITIYLVSLAVRTVKNIPTLTFMLITY